MIPISCPRCAQWCNCPKLICRRMLCLLLSHVGPCACPCPSSKNRPRPTPTNKPASSHTASQAAAASKTQNHCTFKILSQHQQLQGQAPGAGVLASQPCTQGERCPQHTLFNPVKSSSVNVHKQPRRTAAWAFQARSCSHPATAKSRNAVYEAANKTSLNKALTN